ncbi:MAG: 2-C-methyl-D-erythritol 4-phosphate cytidylyltransferase, partial [Ignavibacteriaceae bacterium]
YVQTPQIFTFGVLQNAMEKAQKEHFYGTDESMLVKRLKKKIYISDGSLLNFKVTTKSDIELLKKLI